TNATATRASVAPRLKASAPERASSTMASATAWGSGSRRAPASCEPAYQAAIKSASEMSRMPMLTPRRLAGRRFQQEARVPGRRAPPRRSRQRRQVKQHDQPGVAEPVGDPRPAHDKADHRAKRHGDDERDRDARERRTEI